MDVIIQCSYNDPAEEAEALMTMRSMKVAGVILTAVASRNNLELLRRLEQEMRIVYMDSYVHEDCDYVMNDNRQSMAMVTRYLLGRGHRPAYLGAPPVAHPSPEERLAGYLDAMAGSGHAAARRRRQYPALLGFRSLRIPPRARLARQRRLETRRRHRPRLRHRPARDRRDVGLQAIRPGAGQGPGHRGPRRPARFPPTCTRR